MATGLFLGSPEAAVPSLHAACDVLDIRGVVTRPPSRRGRGRTLHPTPVAAAAADLGLPVHTPTSKAELADLPLGVDVAVVVAFGMIVPEPVLAQPRLGFLNVHFSLLPRWRGAAPVERAILAGDDETGVCLMQMEAGLDTGPVYACTGTPVGERNAGELTDLLATLGADLLATELPGIVSGASVALPQAGEVTHAPKLSREEAELDLTEPVASVVRRIRAFTPRPGAFVPTDEGPLKVWDGEAADDRLDVGEWYHDGDRLLVGTGDGALRLREVQAPGGRRLPALAWANGRRGAFPAAS